MNTMHRVRFSAKVLLAAAVLAAFQLAGSGAASAAINNGVVVRTISISGTGAVTVAPDIAQVSVSVVTEAPKAEAAKNENAKLCSGVIKAVRALGIPEEQIKTANIDLRRHDEADNGKRTRRVSYEMVTVLTFSKVPVKNTGEVIDAAVKNGANNIESVSYSSSDSKNQYNNVLRMAVKDAQGKAAAMAEAAGMRLGKPITMSQSGSYAPRMMSFSMKNVAEDTSDNMPVMPGVMDITASVSIEFELLN